MSHPQNSYHEVKVNMFTVATSDDLALFDLNQKTLIQEALIRSKCHNKRCNSGDSHLVISRSPFTLE